MSELDLLREIADLKARLSRLESDDRLRYVIGTWTPTFTDLALGAGTAPSFAGDYIRIGNLVYFVVVITPGTATTASTASVTYINNLPFTASKNSTLTVSNNLAANIGIGLIVSGTTSGFTPTWGATSGIMTISGCYLS